MQILIIETTVYSGNSFLFSQFTFLVLVLTAVAFYLAYLSTISTGDSIQRLADVFNISERTAHRYLDEARQALHCDVRIAKLPQW